MALNFLWGDLCVPSSPPRLVQPSASQSKVHSDVFSSTVRMLEHLKVSSAVARTVVSKSQNPPLVSSMVELGSAACTRDSMAFVQPSLHKQVFADGGIFRDVTRSRKAVPKFSGIDWSEYIKINLRGLEIGKLRLKPLVCGGGSVFAVGKPSGGQREVWHDRYNSSLVPAPPKPRHQPTLSCLLDLDASPTSTLYFSKRDTVSYFDCLRAPKCVHS